MVEIKETTVQYTKNKAGEVWFLFGEKGTKQKQGGLNMTNVANQRGCIIGAAMRKFLADLPITQVEE